MTKAAWFNTNGKFNFWDEQQQPDSAELSEGYIKADIDETIPLWRFTYNSETKTVDVFEPTLNIAQAEAKLLANQADEDSDRAAAAAAAGYPNG